jgi:branched-subunit amino acid transport protein
MSANWLIGAMAAIVYALRITGLLASQVRVPETLERALTFTPVAVLSAITVSSLTTQSREDPLRLVAALGAGLIVYQTRQMWACIFGGLSLYWSLRLLLG